MVEMGEGGEDEMLEMGVIGEEGEFEFEEGMCEEGEAEEEGE